jgi:type I restriction enzyme S subunit
MSVQVEETAGLNRWQRYPVYRDSGVDWLGEIPAHWDVKRLKSLGDIRPSNIDKKTVDDQHPVRLCNYTDVYYRDLITEDIEFMEATATPEQIRRFELRAGDVIITKDSESADDIAVAAFVPGDLPGVVCGYHLALIRPISKIDGRYLFRAFAATPLSGQFEISARGITRYGLSYAAIADAFMLVPPLSEQRAIAAFLDRKTGEIDALIAKKRELIARLQEQRSAIISHAVTRGLNPDAPMKDSGIEWLGEIPVAWDVVRLKYVSPFVTVGIVVTPAKYYENEGIPCLRSLNIKPGYISDDNLVFISPESNELLEKSKIYRGDLVIVRTGQPGTAAVVDERFDGANCIDLIIVRKSPEFLSDYVMRVANSDFAKTQYSRLSSGAIQQHFNIGMASNLLIPLPPLPVQHDVVNYLTEQTERIDDLIAKAEETITRLQEYRAALISAAVTGRIDVREEVS